MERPRIYMILMIEELPKTEEDFAAAGFSWGSERLVGFYPNRAFAIQMVECNTADIHEHLFHNVLIEEVCEGLYSPLDHNPTRDWFEYDEETNSYNRIEEPSYLERYCNFTIG